ncbi:hypothetical protein J7E98_36305, partial [Streptomyces sp. ISL-86]|nr:hypothetical protein [Streptomyces sp. ISL-86]
MLGAAVLVAAAVVSGTSAVVAQPADVRSAVKTERWLDPGEGVWVVPKGVNQITVYSWGAGGGGAGGGGAGGTGGGGGGGNGGGAFGQSGGGGGGGGGSAGGGGGAGGSSGAFVECRLSLDPPT